MTVGRPGRRPPRARLANGGITEDLWQRVVLGLFAYFDWRSYHTHDSRRSAAGFPDVIAVRGPRLVVAELKPDKGARRTTAAALERRPEWLRHVDLADAQAAWLDDLRTVRRAVVFAAATAAVNSEAYVPEYGPRIDVKLWRPRDLEDVVATLDDGVGTRAAFALADARARLGL